MAKIPVDATRCAASPSPVIRWRSAGARNSVASRATSCPFNAIRAIDLACRSMAYGPTGRARNGHNIASRSNCCRTHRLRRNLCITPSAQLNQHEWAKHGSCMGVTPAQYFDQSHGAVPSLVWPDMDRLSRRPLTVGQFKDAFARANRGKVPVNAIRVTVTGGRWLDELWLCLDTRLQFRRCAAPTRMAGCPTAAS